jgi:hypothetical protein
VDNFLVQFKSIVNTFNLSHIFRKTCIHKDAFAWSVSLPDPQLSPSATMAVMLGNVMSLNRVSIIVLIFSQSEAVSKVSTVMLNGHVESNVVLLLIYLSHTGAKSRISVRFA